MKASFSFNTSSLDQFKYNCEAAIRNVYKGTKKGTEQACKEILANSLLQVPADTSTLKSSAYYEVAKRTDIASSSFEAVLGYGGNGDPINPKTGQHASKYMLVVHEDLSAFHPIGKAKFLEDPVRDYAKSNFKRVIFVNVREALAPVSK